MLILPYNLDGEWAIISVRSRLPHSFGPKDTMFRAILFIHNPNSVDAVVHPIEKLALDSKQVSVQRVVNWYPSPYELSVMVNSHDPEIMFIDISSWESASELAAHIHSVYPEISIVGFGAGWADEVKSRCEQCGITDLLVSPVTMKEFKESVQRAIHRIDHSVQDNLLALLPAKAGSGCTTITLNTAACLAEELGKKVLVVEADLHSGALSFLLNVRNRRSVLDALENVDRLDYTIWSSCVVRQHGVDFLCANRAKPLPSWNNYLHLLRFVKSRYDHVLVDLPEVVNEATTEIVNRSKYVFVVCTPEAPALRLAQKRCRELESVGVKPERIGIVMNRWHETDLREADIEQLLEHGVAGILPNDYPNVSRATKEQRAVDRSTSLGRTFLSFAKALAGVPEEIQEERRSRLRFLEGMKHLGRLAWRSQ